MSCCLASAFESSLLHLVPITHISISNLKIMHWLFRLNFGIWWSPGYGLSSLPYQGWMDVCSSLSRSNVTTNASIFIDCLYFLNYREFYSSLHIVFLVTTLPSSGRTDYFYTSHICIKNALKSRVSLVFHMANFMESMVMLQKWITEMYYSYSHQE